VILRLFIGSAPIDARDAVQAHLAGPYLDVGRAIGLSSYAAGLRVDGPTVRFLVASTSQRVEPLRAALGDALDRPLAPLLPGVTPEGVEHFELVSDPVPVHPATADAVLRLARMVVKAGREEEFYSVVRRGVSEGSRRGDLLSYHLGRRVEGSHLAAAVSAWRSPGALGELVHDADRPLWGDELTPLLEGFTVEHFEAIRLAGG
jgi:hypothetical protein